MELLPEGVLLEPDTYTALINTMKRDCRCSRPRINFLLAQMLMWQRSRKIWKFIQLMSKALGHFISFSLPVGHFANSLMTLCRVLESFKIMDYSLLVGIHNLDQAAKERMEEEQNKEAPAFDRQKWVFFFGRGEGDRALPVYLISTDIYRVLKKLAIIKKL